MLVQIHLRETCVKFVFILIINKPRKTKSYNHVDSHVSKKPNQHAIPHEAAFASAERGIERRIEYHLLAIRRQVLQSTQQGEVFEMYHARVLHCLQVQVFPEKLKSLGI